MIPRPKSPRDGRFAPICLLASSGDGSPPFARCNPVFSRLCRRKRHLCANKPAAQDRSGAGQANLLHRRQSGIPGKDNEGHTSNAGFVVTAQGVVVFDALGTPSLGWDLLQQIRKITDQPVRYVVVSHYHADHIYGLQAFKDHTDGIIIAQERAERIPGERGDRGRARHATARSAPRGSVPVGGPQHARRAARYHLSTARDD